MSTETATHITWNDQIGKRGRRAWLLLIKDDVIHSFQGDSIPGVVAVIGYDFEPKGKWSSTTFRLALAPGVRAISGLNGWNTATFREGLRAALRWPEPLDRWHEIANAMGVSLSSVQAFLHAFKPKEAEELDKVEEDLAAVDCPTEAQQDDDGAEIVTISFGHPMLKEMRAGFWDWPIRIIAPDGSEVGRVFRPDRTADSHLWEAQGRVRILAAEHAPGRHGGYWSFRLAVPAGCRAVHNS